MVAGQSVLVLTRAICKVYKICWFPLETCEFLCALWYLLPMMSLNIRLRSLYVLGFFGFFFFSLLFCFAEAVQGSL